MKDFIERASATGAQFEFFSASSSGWNIGLDKTGLRDAEASISSGISLRLIKDGRLGFGNTTNLRNPQAVVDSALLALKAGPEAVFAFPNEALPAIPHAWYPASSSVTPESMADAMFTAYRYLSSRCEADVTISSSCKRMERRILNSAGLDVAWKSSTVQFDALLRSAAGDWMTLEESGLSSASVSVAMMDKLLERFALLGRDIRPASGRQKVLFMPEAMYALLWRLEMATCARTLLQKASPLAGREGTEVLSPLLTVRDNPLDESLPGARPVDDEGVPCRDFVTFDKGVFRGYYADLSSAAKLGMKPTGHGYRRTKWGGDPVMLPPTPYPYRTAFEPGEKNFDELLREMGEGLVVFGVLGAHSGNIQNGDFSVGVGPGFVVRDGKLAGRAAGTMVSGNVYDVLRRVIAVGSGKCAAANNNPPLLLDGVDVSA